MKKLLPILLTILPFLSKGQVPTIVNSLQVKSAQASAKQVVTNNTGIAYFDNLGNLQKGSISGVIGSFFLPTISSLYAMGASIVPDSTIVYIGGYYSINDGGGGIFYYLSSSIATDNGGNVIKPTTNVTSGRWLRMFNGAFNGLWFGMIPDGHTDNANMFNKLLSASKAFKKSIFIPSGIYNFIAATANWDVTTLNGISFYGDGNTELTTSTVGTTLLSVTSTFLTNDITIHDIWFNSTHPVTTTSTIGVFVQGGPTNWFHNVKVNNCRFVGFNTAIGFQGIVGVKLSYCLFESPLGHDNALNNQNPAVYVIFADNTNGQVYNAIVEHNWASGYTGTSSITGTVTKRPMDGFLYGAAYGYDINHNYTVNFGQENYTIQTLTTFPWQAYVIKFDCNYLDQSIPVGSINGASPILSNYGLRCDQSNLFATGNTFYNCSIGILCYPFQVSTLRLHSFHIIGNHFYFPHDRTNYLATLGIRIQGFISQYSCKITDNEFELDSSTVASFNAVSIIKLDTGTVSNNTVHITNITGAGTNTAFVFQNDTTISAKNNIVTGITRYSVTSSQGIDTL